MTSMNLRQVSHPGVDVVAAPDAVAPRSAPLPVVGKRDRWKRLFLGRSSNGGWESQIVQFYLAIVQRTSALKSPRNAITPVQESGRAESISVVQDKVEDAI